MGQRIQSLDQFRGYTVAAMFVVNFLGGFASVPAILRHHNTYCSYADIVMPHFFFAVGFSLRLVLLKEIERHGAAAAYKRGLKRGFSLIVFGIIFYELDGNYRSWSELQELGIHGFFSESFKRSAFQALTHIGVTTLWVLPVITLRFRARLFFLLGSTILHVVVSHLFWYETLQTWRVIDGGLLGFVSWTIPTLAGSFAYDWVKRSPSGSLKPLVTWGAVLMIIGYAISCLSQGGQLAAPPFCPPKTEVDLWTMSQRAGSASYLVFAAGFSLALFSAFVRWCDIRGRKLSLFTDIGENAFAAYIIHMIVLVAFGRFGPKDAPLWYAVSFMLFGCLISIIMVRWCNRRNIYLRL
nr:acyltransferase family protein [bacterium]